MVDKLYFMFPEVETKYLGAKKAYEEHQRKAGKSNMDFTLATSRALKGKSVSENESVRAKQLYNEWLEQNSKDFTKIIVKKTYTPSTNPATRKQDIANMSREERNNYIFDLQWSIYTNPATAVKMFNPGGFDSFKSAARMVKLGENGIAYNEVKGKTLSQLDDLVESTNTHNITNISTQIYFFQQNMIAAKLIGIMANANVSHAFCQTNDKLLIGTPLEFNNVKYGYWKDAKHQEKYSPMYSESGRFVSKNLASGVAASVDAVKDPVFRDININMNTINEFIVMLRMGIDPENAALLLAQPILKDYNAVLDASKDEFSDEEPLTTLLNMTKYHSIRDGYMSDINDYNPTSSLTTENLYNNLNEKNGIDPNFQAQVLGFFLALKDLTKSNSDLTYLTKFNSLSNAPGPNISDNVHSKHKVLNILKAAPMAAIRGIRTVINDNPILSAFYNNTIANSPFTPIFEKHWSYHTNTFSAIINVASSLTASGNLIEPGVIEDLYNSYILYELYKRRVLYNDKESNKLSMNYFLKIFPKKVFDFINEVKNSESEYSYLANNVVLQSIYKGFRKGVNFPLISMESGNIKGEAQEVMKNAWTELVMDPDLKVREIGIGLFFYNLYRSGYNFNPATFLQFASAEVKHAIANYLISVEHITKDHNSTGEVDMGEINSFMVWVLRNDPEIVNIKMPAKIISKILSKLNKTSLGNFVTLNFFDGSETDEDLFDYLCKVNKEQTYKVSKLAFVANKVLYVAVDNKNTSQIKVTSGVTEPITYRAVGRLGLKNTVIEYSKDPLGPSNVDLNVQEVEEDNTTYRTPEQDIRDNKNPETLADNAKYSNNPLIQKFTLQSIKTLFEANPNENLKELVISRCIDRVDKPKNNLNDLAAVLGKAPYNEATDSKAEYAKEVIDKLWASIEKVLKDNKVC